MASYMPIQVSDDPSLSARANAVAASHAWAVVLPQSGGALAQDTVIDGGPRADALVEQLGRDGMVTAVRLHRKAHISPADAEVADRLEQPVMQEPTVEDMTRLLAAHYHKLHQCTRTRPHQVAFDVCYLGSRIIATHSPESRALTFNVQDEIADDTSEGAAGQGAASGAGATAGPGSTEGPGATAAGPCAGFSPSCPLRRLWARLPEALWNTAPGAVACGVAAGVVVGSVAIVAAALVSAVVNPPRPSGLSCRV
jgi:hypothetical protein